VSAGVPTFTVRMVRNTGAYAATGGWWWLLRPHLRRTSPPRSPSTARA
jgi:hypothetical protein